MGRTMTEPFISTIFQININNEMLRTLAPRGFMDKKKRAEIAIWDTKLDGKEAEWTIIELGQPGEVINLLVRGVGSVLYAGSSLGNIFRSADFGETWTTILSGTIDNCLMLNYSELTGAIFAASADKLIRSINGGETWEEVKIEWQDQGWEE